MKRELLIKKVIEENNYKTIVEVGTYRGQFAKHLHSTNPNKLYLVDPWKKFGKDVFPDYTQYEQDKWDLLYESVKAKFNYDNVTIIRKTSEEAINMFEDNSIDLVYIDGNYTFDFVKMDLNLWLPKVKKGGMLCGHDYQLSSVTKAVKQFLEERNLAINLLFSEKHCGTYFIKI